LASADPAVTSASGTARRAARSVRRIGAGFYEEAGSACEDAGSGHASPVTPDPESRPNHARVTLPQAVGSSYEVYVNGVRQQEGNDFVREGGELVFQRSLAKEGKLGFWRWTSLFLGIAGTYRQNDSVDVVYELGGRRFVATGLPIIQDETGEESVDPGGPGADGGKGA